jgi:hypothetical protein
MTWVTDCKGFAFAGVQGQAPGLCLGFVAEKNEFGRVMRDAAVVGAPPAGVCAVVFVRVNQVLVRLWARCRSHV